MLVWVTVKLSLTVPEFCRMKFRIVPEPGSTFLLFAGIRVALSAMKFTILDSMLTTDWVDPETSRLPPRV